MACDDFEHSPILSKPFVGFENFLFCKFVGKANDVNEVSLHDSDVRKMISLLFGEIISGGAPSCGDS